MKLFVVALLPALVASAAARPQPDGTFEKRATPTVYLAGDSTMAKGGGGTGTEGWGQYLGYSLNIPVVNDAVAGRSARSYTEEGRFQTLVDTVKSGDFVVIEFGHNDGGSLSTTDNGRTDCPGDGEQTCTSPTTGETVYTFVFYEVEAGKALQAKGANVIFSSQTPDNPWESGTFEYTPSRFVGYAQKAASTIGAAYVDHGQYVANRFQSLGLSTVDSFYPNDHTHTSPQGANIVSAAFVKGVLCANDVLAAHVKNTTSSVPGSCI
ncbi:SGNH hydrolase [Dichomitus squalens]|nr:SGNH hydrolase [Dichomitus squalens]